jgi:hypothetical protein
LENNLKSFKNNLDKLESKAQENIEEQLYLVAENYQMTINIMHLLELIENNHFSLNQELLSVMTVFQENQQQLQIAYDPENQNSKLFSPSRQSSHKNLFTVNMGGNQLISPKFAFQLISNNTAEFHLLATMIDPVMIAIYNHKIDDNDGGRPPSASATPKRIRGGGADNKIDQKLLFPSSTDQSNNNQDSGGLDIPLLELAKLYKMAIYPRPFSINQQIQSVLPEFQRVYCVLPFEELKILLCGGWKGLKDHYSASNKGKASQLFSNDAGETLLYFNLL